MVVVTGTKDRPRLRVRRALCVGVVAAVVGLSPAAQAGKVQSADGQFGTVHMPYDFEAYCTYYQPAGGEKVTWVRTEPPVVSAARGNQRQQVYLRAVASAQKVVEGAWFGPVWVDHETKTQELRVDYRGYESGTIFVEVVWVGPDGKTTGAMRAQLDRLARVQGNSSDGQRTDTTC